MYPSFVPDQGAMPPLLLPGNPPIAERALLAKHYSGNAKKPVGGTFRNLTETATAAIVGPLGSRSFSLHIVEKALADMETGFGGTSAPNASVNGDATCHLNGGIAGEAGRRR